MSLCSHADCAEGQVDIECLILPLSVFLCAPLSLSHHKAIDTAQKHSMQWVRARSHDERHETEERSGESKGDGKKWVKQIKQKSEGLG